MTKCDICDTQSNEIIYFKREDYINYLIEELEKLNEITASAIQELKLESWWSKSAFNITCGRIAEYLSYLKGESVEDECGFPCYKRAPLPADVLALEGGVNVIQYLFAMKSLKVADYWTLSTQLARASLALYLTERGVLVNCLAYDADDEYVFSLDNATKDDIRNAAFSNMYFDCPDSGARYRFASYDDENEVYLKPEVSK